MILSKTFPFNNTLRRSDANHSISYQPGDLPANNNRIPEKAELVALRELARNEQERMEALNEQITRRENG
jgi:hypothetical protein